MGLKLTSLARIWRSRSNPEFSSVISKPLLDEPSQDDEFLDLLYRLQEKRALLDVQVDETPGTYTSAIVAIDAENKAFMLDELVPVAGHRALVNQRLVSVSCQFFGMDLSFDGLVNKVEMSDGVAGYWLSFPTDFNHTQRRASPRLILHHSKRLPMRVAMLDEQRSIRGFATDISEKGVGFMLNEQVELYTGNILKSCTLTLSETININFSLEVRFTRLHSSNQTKVGGVVRNIGDGTAKILNNYLHERRHLL